MKRRYSTIINLFSSVSVLLVNVAVGFWLSPFIIQNIGIEANGFVSMASNFITFASLIVTALNAMAARYITISYAKKDYSQANLYYNSVFWGNLIIVLVLLLPAISLIVFFEHVFNVPQELVVDVKILFVFVFLSFFISTGAPNYDVGCFVSNRLDRHYIPDMVTQIVRALTILIMFSILHPRVWYVSMVSFSVSIAMLLINRINTHVLTPELKVFIDKENRLCSKKAIRELVGSGMWSSISNLGNILLSGLDLLVCNILLGATAMGVLAISKNLSIYLQQFSSSLTRAFTPELTIDYAKGNKEELLKNMNRSMKITASLMTIATACLLTLGKRFFSLWVPGQDASLLAVLSGLSFFGYFFTSGTQILYNVFTVTNHVKESSIAQIICGVASISITVILVKFTHIGIYAVAGVSSVCNLVRNMTFTLPMTAKWLGLKKHTFYLMSIKTLISTLVISSISIFVQSVVHMEGWLGLCIEAIIISALGFGCNLVVLLSKEDRTYFFEIFQRKVATLSQK